MNEEVPQRGRGKAGRGRQGEEWVTARGN